MRIDPRERVAGRPIVEIHGLLKHHSDFLKRHIVEFELDVEPDEADEILAGLHREGYVQLKREDDDRFYVATIRGRALGMARLEVPVPRARAAKLVREFLKRVRIVNADPGFLIKVVEVRVFGSYARGAPAVGDVDLAIRYERKDPDSYSDRATAQVRDEKRKGRFFSTYIDELSWPEDWAREFLRGDSGILSLHDLDTENRGPVAEATTVLFSSPTRVRAERGKGTKRSRKATTANRATHRSSR